MSYAGNHVFGFSPNDDNNYPDWYNNSHRKSDETGFEQKKNVSENKPSKKPLFTRGYQESRERLARNPHFTRSCFNCASYFQASGDKEEMCQDPNVLQFDMVVTDNNVYCVRWRPSSTNKSEQQSLFKKHGRSQLD